MVIEITVGALLAGVLVLQMRLFGVQKDRGFYAGLLVAVAIFYPVFETQSLMQVDADLLLHLAFGFLVICMALAGMKKIPWLLPLGWLLHAIFDGLGPPHAPGGMPAWWPGVCLGFDGLMALVTARLTIFRP